MAEIQQRPASKLHFVSEEEAKAWNKFVILREAKNEVGTVFEGVFPALMDFVDVHSRFDVIFPEGASWGSLQGIKERDIVVIKRQEREIKRFEFLGSAGAPGEVILEFQDLGPDSLQQ